MYTMQYTLFHNTAVIAYCSLFGTRVRESINRTSYKLKVQELCIHNQSNKQFKFGHNLININYYVIVYVF